MSLAQITEKIERDARAEAEQIIARARAQEAEIKNEMQVEINEIEAAAKLRFDRERPEIYRRREIVAKLDIAKLMLASQRRLIDDVFDTTLDNMRGLGRDEYLGFCGRLLGNAMKTKEEVLEIGKGERYIDAAWLEDFNKKHGAMLTLADSRADISGGFLLHNGRVCVNCSLEMLVQAAREKIEPEVVKRLFPTPKEE